MTFGLLSSAWPGLLFGFCFFIGAIPFGLLIARVFKIKEFRRTLPQAASRPHLAEVAGIWPAGILSVLLDFAKGVLTLVLLTPVGYRFLSKFIGATGELSGLEESITLSWAAGFFTVLGHCLSPWLQFRGGKGVAIVFGVITVLSPLASLLGLIAFCLALIYSRLISLASIVGLMSASVTYLVLNPVGTQLWVGAVMIFLVLLRHEANIDALLEQREPKFVPKF